MTRARSLALALAAVAPLLTAGTGAAGELDLALVVRPGALALAAPAANESFLATVTNRGNAAALVVLVAWADDDAWRVTAAAGERAIVSLGPGETRHATFTVHAPGARDPRGTAETDVTVRATERDGRAFYSAVVRARLAPGIAPVGLEPVEAAIREAVAGAIEEVKFRLANPRSTSVTLDLDAFVVIR